MRKPAPEDETKTESLTLRLSPTIKALLYALAKREVRSVAQLIEVMARERDANSKR